MMEKDPNSGLLVDLYELTMASGYFHEGRHEVKAVFDHFFRDHPFEGGYTVLAGVEDLIEKIEDFCFGDDAPTSEIMVFMRTFWTI